MELVNHVAGQATPPRGDTTLPVEEPASGRVVGRFGVSGAEDVNDAVRAARAGFEQWSRVTPRERAEALLALAAALERDAEQLARIESVDAGKPLAHARDEHALAIDNLRFFAGAARCLEGRAAGEYAPGRTSMLRREPIGVIGQIAPWNYPLMMAVWKLGPAIAAGNAVVLKPAQTTVRSTVALAELAAEILPPGVLNVVLGDGATGAALAGHPDVDMVALTGSRATGEAVATAAARRVARTHLELGGKAPVLVFEDADLDLTAERIAGGAFYNAGQDCSAAARLLVHDRVHDALVDRVVAAAGRLRGGALDDAATTLGPLNSAPQLARVQGFLERLPQHVTIACGGRAAGAAGAAGGWFMPATVLTDVQAGDEVAGEEIFGPVLSVERFGDEREALALANATTHGLAASVFTGDVGRALRVGTALRFGKVWVNDHGTEASEMPHGGRGSSGYGSDMSVYAVEEYTTLKHLMLAHD
jgi:betaine-aldehyde dehydrogenase